METIQHQLQQFDPGIIWLDDHHRVTAYNDVARRVLGPQVENAIGRDILSFHPEKSRAKVAWLLEAAGQAEASPPPVTMMINVPDRILLIKVSRMLSGETERDGLCMIFFDLTEVITSPAELPPSREHPLQLFKLPVYVNHRVMLIDLDDVVHLKAEGHYTTVFTRTEHYLCNLSLSDLEQRIGQDRYLRVHRSHMVNIQHARGFDKSDEHCFVLMDTEDEALIPVSRSKVRSLKDILGLN